MILSCNHISKAYGEEVILDDCSFFVNDHEKAAIVGNNGAGKSTILKIIMNELSSDSGDVIIGKDKSVGYLAQYQNLDTDNSIYEEVRSVKQNIIDMENKLREYESLMANGCDSYDDIVNSYTNLHHQFELLNGYAYKSEVDGTLRGLGFEDSDFNKKISTLSGGQKTRVALCKLLIQKPDIILLDINMPRMDGIEVCRLIRSKVLCPILFLTARVDEDDKINGLLSGGDDYITKPFSLRELEARIVTNIKREERHQQKTEYRFMDEMLIDYSEKIVAIAGHRMEFTKIEYQIIEFLSMHPGQVFDKERIYAQVCGYDAEGDSRTITELVRRIRKKIADYSEKEYIETVWGIGYRWKK